MTISLLILCILAALSSCGKDPVRPLDPPVISKFEADRLVMRPGDSALISYTVAGAASLTLLPDSLALTPLKTGSVYVKPLDTTIYTLIARNKDHAVNKTLTVAVDGRLPDIRLLSLSPDTMMIGDSTTLTWATDLADVMTVDQGIGALPTPDSGQLVLHPTTSTTYRAIATNMVGADTAYVSVRIESPVSVAPKSGFYYKGTMGSSVQDPLMAFQVQDALGELLTLPWVDFYVADGDGALSVDSARANGLAGAQVAYDFSGSRGDAVVEASVTGISLIDVQLRANTIILGTRAQGQYVLMSDTYADVKNFNGPASIDIDPNYWVTYANYEAALGLVIMIDDVDQTETAGDDEPVLAIFLTSNFTGGKTADSIGIGSSIQEVRTAYGPADTTWYDGTFPPAQFFSWGSLGLDLYTTVSSDSTVFEMHIYEGTGVEPSLQSARKKQPREGKALVPPGYRQPR